MTPPSRTITALLAGSLLAVGLTACGGNSDNSGPIQPKVSTGTDDTASPSATPTKKPKKVKHLPSGSDAGLP